MSRRRFITGLGIATGAAVAAGYGLTVWQNGDSSGGNGAAPRVTKGALGSGRADRTLVVVELGGGNDGLSTVVPLNDPAYHSLRPTLAVANPIPLDDTVGLHPNLAKLAARYAQGHVAIVEGVGYPEPNLSHFASLAYWWAGTPGESGGSGWLGRFLDGTVGFDDPLAAIGIGPVPSPALLGTKSFATSIADTSGLQPAIPSWVESADDLVAAWGKFAPASPDPSTLLGGVQDAIRLTVKARNELDADLASRADTGGPSDDLYNRQAGQRSPVTDSLRLAAQLVASKHPPRVVYVSGLGDYDTHQGQAQRHPALMSDLDAGLETFFTTLERAGVADRALVMTVSEFGRRANENGSGTDHGAAAPHFLVGSQVKGGRYGTPPSLTQLDRQGNLPFSVDFRTLYATALEPWLGVEAGAVVGKGFDPLPVITT